MKTQFEEQVYSLIKKVPKGKVTTYREIGLALGVRAFRAIGQTLKKNPYSPQVPCHRVVRTDGAIGGFRGQTKGKEIEEKISMLKEEGVEVKNNKIDLNKYLFKLS